MKRYPEYKDSGIEWLGEIPEHWEVKRLKWFAKICNGQDQKRVKDENGEYPILGTGGVFGQSKEYLHNKPSVLLGRKGTIDKPIYIDVPFWTVDTLYYTDIYSTTSSKFFFYLCVTINFAKYKTGSAVPSMTQEDLNQIIFSTPQIAEQTTIANFLDHKTLQIDDLISKKERLIELLKEERAAMINHAVTKGLDPNVPMKDSGIEWLGEIPEHWETYKLKRICNIQGRIGFKGYSKDDLVSKDEGALTLGAKHINNKNLIDLSNPEYISWEKYYESPEIMLKTGDVLLTQRGTLGKVAIIEKEIGEATINPSMVLLTKMKILGKYLYFYFNSTYINSSVEITSSATAVPMISQEQLGNFNVLIPKEIEQATIANFLDHKTQQIDKNIELNKKEIELLKEYKTSLINETVTGKIDVRDFKINHDSD